MRYQTVSGCSIPNGLTARSYSRGRVERSSPADLGESLKQRPSADFPVAPATLDGKGPDETFGRVETTEMFENDSVEELLFLVTDGNEFEAGKAREELCLRGIDTDAALEDQ